MKTRFLTLLFTGLIFGLFAAGGFAQTEEPASELYVFWDEVVHPSKVAQYEESGKQMVSMFKDFPYKWSATSTDDLHYFYGIPVKDLADAEAMFKAFEEADKKLGDKTKELNQSFLGTTESMRIQMWRLNHELSYVPENPRVNENEVKFLRITYFYYDVGTEDKVVPIVKKFKELYRSKNIPDGYNVWVGGMGTDGPVHCVVMGAKGAADYYSEAAKINELLGDEGEALWNEFMTVVKRIEPKNGYARPELGTMAPPEKPTDMNQP
jgi:hypothetical protein